MIRITPKSGLIIRDPEHQDRRVLPREGIVVRRLNPFWLRRLNDGDIEVSEETPVAPVLDARIPEAPTVLTISLPPIPRAPEV